MTYREFDGEVNSWDDLVSFCSEYCLDTCEDIITSSDVISIVYNILEQRLDDGYKLSSVQDLLDSIDCTDNYFYYDGEEISNVDILNFDDYKSDAASAYDEDWGWDFDDEYEEDDEDEFWYEDEAKSSPDIDIAFLMELVS